MTTGQTEAGQSNPYRPLCFVGDTKMTQDDLDLWARIPLTMNNLHLKFESNQTNIVVFIVPIRVVAVELWFYVTFNIISSYPLFDSLGSFIFQVYPKMPKGIFNLLTIKDLLIRSPTHLRIEVHFLALSLGNKMRWVTCKSCEAWSASQGFTCGPWHFISYWKGEEMYFYPYIYYTLRYNYPSKRFHW